MSDPASHSAREIARRVLRTESDAVAGLIDQLDESFDQAVELLAACGGHVVCTGMGKSGLIMKKVAATFSSTGTPALFLHPAEAVHGDIGMLAAGDVVLAASFSGATSELLRLVETVRRLGVQLIVMTGNSDSPLAKLADLHLPVAIDKEACPLNLAPTASTTAALAMGDALAMAVLDAKGFTDKDFARLHPGGELGKRLLCVSELMHRGDDLPSVALNAPMREVSREISAKSMGITAVVDAAGRLAGCVSDGDIRRHLARGDDLLSATAGDCMTAAPQTIAADEVASAALQRMEERRITSLFVRDDDGRPQGIVHIHDLWRLEMF